MSIYTVNGNPLKYDNKWLANGGTPSSELPPYDSSDAGKALVVNNEGDNVEWQIVGSSGTVDQHYDGTSTNAQSGIAVAEALQTVETLPSSSSSDANKVLTVNSQGEPEWMSSQGGSDVFIADSTTTSEEMYQAYLAGKVLFYKDSTYGMFSVFCKTYSGECSFQGYHASTTNSDLRYGNFVTAFMKSETIYNGHVFPQSNIFSYNLSFHETRVLDTPALPGNAGKILAVNGTATAVEWVAAPTLSVDQQYSSVSTNAQSGTAVAQAVSGVDAVPDVTSSDNGKVLVATYSGGTGSYAWASAPPANAIILDRNSTWDDFHTPYSAGRKDIYYKHTSPYSPIESRAELYLHLTAVSDVDGMSTNFTFALFEGAWNSGGVDYSVRCKFRYSGGPLVFLTSWVVDQSYSSSSSHAQSGTAVAEAISRVSQVPPSTQTDANKVLTVNGQGIAEWATPSGGTTYTQGNMISLANNQIAVNTTAGITDIQFVNALPANPVAAVLYLIPTV